VIKLGTALLTYGVRVIYREPIKMENGNGHIKMAIDENLLISDADKQSQMFRVFFFCFAM